MPENPETCEHPALLFVRLYELEDEIIELLATPFVDSWKNTQYFSQIPAIKRVREMTKWSLHDAKKFVDDIFYDRLQEILKRREENSA